MSTHEQATYTAPDARGVQRAICDDCGRDTGDRLYRCQTCHGRAVVPLPTTGTRTPLIYGGRRWIFCPACAGFGATSN